MAKLAGFIEDFLNAISLIIVVFLMLLTVVEVVGRYAFNYPIPGYHEIVELCVPAFAFLGIARLQRKGGHINIDVFLDRLSVERRYLLECFFFLIALSIFILIVIATFINSMQAYSMDQATENLQIPTWPFRLSIAVGSMVLCLRFIVSFAENIRKVVKIHATADHR